MIDLPPQSQRLFDRLLGHGDVPVADLVEALGVQQSKYPQQILGPYITRLNRRLKNHRMKVEPGRTKQTYRLVVL